MIERKVLQDKFAAFSVDEFIRTQLKDVPIKEVLFEKNPVGERITIFTSTPGLVIGREGLNIRSLTAKLKEKFNYENPQIKIGEIKSTHLSARIVAKIIANDLANFGSQKFKLTGFKALTGIMNAGAMGCEILISGKLPSARAKTWRFAKGYLKKTGSVSDFIVDKAKDHVTLKTGVVGIQVQIMLPDTPLPDKIIYLNPEQVNVSKKEMEKEEIEAGLREDKAEEEIVVDEKLIEEKEKADKLNKTSTKKRGS